MENIDELLSNLSSHNNIKNQEEAISYFSNEPIIDIKGLISLAHKEYWENVSIVLKNRGYKECVPVVDILFERLQDINWPGSQNIIRLLNDFPDSLFQPALENAITKAISTEDDIWLDYLSIFLCNSKTTENKFSNQALYKILASHKSFWES